MKIKLFITAVYLFVFWSIGWSHLADPGYTLSRYSIYGQDAFVGAPHAITDTSDGFVGTDGTFTGKMNMVINSPLKVGGSGAFVGTYNNTIDVQGNASGTGSFSDSVRYNTTKSGSFSGALVVEYGTAYIPQPTFPTYNVQPNTSVNCTASGTTWSGTGCPIFGQSLSVRLPAGQYGTITIDAPAYFEAGDYDIGSLDVNDSLIIDKQETEITRLLVKDDFNLDATHSSSISTLLADDLGRVLVYVQGDVEIQAHVDMAATLVAPNATVTLNPNFLLYGQVMAKEINLSNGFNATLGEFAAFIIPKISVVGAESISFNENSDAVNTNTSNNSRKISISLELEEGIDSLGISVQFKLVTGTAQINGAEPDLQDDTYPSSGTINWAKLQTTSTNAIESFLVDDANYESQEYFDLYLFNPTVAELGTDSNAYRYTEASGKVDTLVYRFYINDDDPSNEAPVFNDASVSIYENHTLNALVLQFLASDSDNDDLSFQILNSQTTFIVSDSSLLLSQALDYETDSVDTLFVEVSDNKGGLDTAQILINILNANDIAPSINDTLITVAENFPVNDTLVTLSYNLGDTVAGQFNLLPALDAAQLTLTGSSLILSSALDYETQDTLYAQVEVVTTAGTDTALVTIVVTDVNDNTPTVGDYNVTLAEDTLVNSAVVAVQAQDLDTADTQSYAITSGNTDSDFAINAATGEITVANSLDYERTTSYTLEVSVTSGGEVVVSTVTITITNVNDSAPSINDTLITVAESFPVNDTLVTLSYNLGDTVAGQFNLLPILDASQLTLTGSSLILSSGLDYETQDTLYAQVEVVTTAGTDTALVTIVVTDVNDNSPTVGDYNVTLAEDTLVNSTVVTVQAQDLDTADTQSYAITSGNTDSDFAINASTGEITVAKSLDYERTTSYTLEVSVTSGGEVVVSTVTITITNINDIDPTINDTLITVAESFPVNDTLVTLRYNLGDTVAGQFNLLPVLDAAQLTLTGSSLILSSGLDYETQDTLYAQVEVVTTAGTDTALVTIVVTDVNDNSPTVGDYNVTLAEDTLVNSTVVTVQAQDLDTADTQSYAITSGNTDSDFAINAATGEITVANSLDYERTTSYTLEVSVTSGGEVVVSTVTITITNVNDSAPTINDTLITVAENFPVNDTLVTLSYNLGDTVAGQFNLLPILDASQLTLTGSSLILSSALDYETQDTLYAQVEVVTTAGTDTALVTIVVTDVNDNSPTVGDYNVTLAEDTLVNSTVVTVQAQDLDTADTQSYAITSGNTDSDFAINAATGEITVAKSLDYERTTSYTLEVSVTSGGEVVVSTVTITITNVNDSDPTINDTLITVAENFPVNDTLVTLSYNLGDTVAGQFNLLPVLDASQLTLTGSSLILSSALDYETQDTLYAQVEVVTTAGTDTALVTIVVTDVNDNTPTVGDYNVTLAEDTLVNSTVVTVQAQDLDTADTQSYAITSGNTDSDFAINAATGEITVANSLDYERTTSYTLEVSVTSGGEVVVSTVTITITNVNDIDPTINDTLITVAENFPVNDTLVTLSYNLGDTVAGQFNLLPVLDASQLTLTGSSLILSSALDYETQDTLYAQVELLTTAGTDTALVTIVVTDVNDNSPTVGDYNVTLAEDTLVNSTVVTVQAQDLDTADTQSYAITSGNTDSDFAINAATGEITVANSLDYERTTSYTLEVSVTSGGEVVVSTVTITITNVNDNSPSIEDSIFTVVENVEGGYVIDSIKVIDLDGDEVVIQVIDSNFHIDSISGVITVKDSTIIDFESDSSYTIDVILISEGDTISTQIEVIVENVIEQAEIEIVEIITQDSVYTEVDSIFINNDPITIIYTKNGVLDTITYNLEENTIEEILEVFIDPTMDLADTSSVVVVYNTINPKITINEVNPGNTIDDTTYTNQDSVEITYIVEYIDENLQTQTETKTIQVVLVEGNNTIFVEYVDKFGNKAVKEVNIVLDTIAPVVEIISPQFGEDITNVTTDVEWEVDGVLQDSLTLETFTKSGRAYIVRTAYDFAGNMGSDTVAVNITKDESKMEVVFVDRENNGVVVTNQVTEEKVAEQNAKLEAYREYSDTDITEETYRIYVSDPNSPGMLSELVYATGNAINHNEQGIVNSINEDDLNGATFKITLSLPVNGYEDQFGNTLGVCSDGTPMWDNSLESIQILIYDQLGQFVNVIRFNGGLEVLSEYQNEKGEVVFYLEEILDADGVATAATQRKTGSGAYIYTGTVRSLANPRECNTLAKQRQVKSEDFIITIGYIRQ